MVNLVNIYQFFSHFSHFILLLRFGLKMTFTPISRSESFEPESIVSQKLLNNLLFLEYLQLLIFYQKIFLKQLL